VLRAGPGPFPVVPGRAHAGPNGAGLVPVHLTRAKFFGIQLADLISGGTRSRNL
jgi:hypothetical protein